MNSAYVMDAFRGRERLAIVFWYYWVLGQLGVVLLFLGAWALIEHVPPGILKVVVGLLVAIPVVAYEIWVLVSLWTCAFNVKTKIWAYVVRAYVVLNAVGYLQGAYEASQWVAERAA